MTLSWLSIFRLGLVQMALGSIVVLTTSTLNRLMVVELGLAATLPGLLVGWHYAVQLTRPKWGLVSDITGRRSRLIFVGMIILVVGALLATWSLQFFTDYFAFAMLASVLAYTLIGGGVGASGTALLALLAQATAPRRRAAAATVTWLMMIFGIAVTAFTVGALLDPYSAQRLLWIVMWIGLAAVTLTLLAIWGVETRHTIRPAEVSHVPLRVGLAEIWQERSARHFTYFVFLSMIAYFMQELILEPYAGLVFAWTPGQTTQLSGAQNAGVFLGMLLVGIAATGFRWGSLRFWVILGCLGSALVLSIIALLPLMPHSKVALSATVSLLGFFNGVFAVAAIGSMMAQAGEGRAQREGTRMGIWGAAQAIAAGAGGAIGAIALDVLRWVFASPASAFGCVFLAEAMLFLCAAYVGARVLQGAPAQMSRARTLDVHRLEVPGE